MKKKPKITEFDASDYLDSEEAIAKYLTAVLEANNPELFLVAIGDIAKARGMAQIADKTGLGARACIRRWRQARNLGMTRF